MYENKTYESIREDILKNIEGIDKSEGSFISEMVSPVAYQFENVYHTLDRFYNVMFLNSCTAEELQQKASDYGIRRKSGTHAFAVVTFSGIEGTVIPINTIVGTVGGLQFATVEEGIISSEGKANVSVKSSETGKKYNVSANSINIITVSVIGVKSVANEKSAVGGTDTESDEELKKRLLYILSTPATSGNTAHYKLWSLEVDGIGDAKVFPLKNGDGTVGVMPITSEKRAPSAELLGKVTSHIEESKPIGATVEVFAPTEIPINTSAVIIKPRSLTLEKIEAEYKKLLNSYIENSVLKTSVVDYYRCLSFLYEVGVTEVREFKLNGGTQNISMEKYEIQVLGTLTITEGV